MTAYRARGYRIAVVAVDPTSPFSGGAILGDRVRLQRHFHDEDVFIRSLATRGALGGLSRSTWDVVGVLDAWGADVILVETVGVGQDELEIAKAAHTTVVVTTPGMGDGIQALKAGILECADVFVVNKADRPGTDEAVRDLEFVRSLGVDVRAAVPLLTSSPDGSERWEAPIVRCVATTQTGLDGLMGSLDAHRLWQQTTAGQVQRTARQTAQLRTFFRDALWDEARTLLDVDVALMTERVQRRELTPYAASRALVGKFREEKRDLAAPR